MKYLTVRNLCQAGKSPHARTRLYSKVTLINFYIIGGECALVMSDAWINGKTCGFMEEFTFAQRKMKYALATQNAELLRMRMYSSRVIYAALDTRGCEWILVSR